MFDADPVTMVTLAQDSATVLAEAGPPTDLPAQVPDFVSDVLGAVGEHAGNAADGIGDTISGLTPGGSESTPEVADAATGTTLEAAGNAPSR